MSTPATTSTTVKPHSWTRSSVSRASRDPLMAPAAEAMAAALAETTIRAPFVPLIANVIAGPVTDPDSIRRLLVEQVTGAVRWRESVLFMRDNGVRELVEIGAGKVLSALTRRIDRGLKACSVHTPQDVDDMLGRLN